MNLPGDTGTTIFAVGSGWVDWEDCFLLAEHWLQTRDAP